MRILLPVLMCLALAACHRDIRNEDAVRRGVMDYLATRQGLNLNSMRITIDSMVFRQNEVDATVAFTPNGGGAPLSIHYVLERKGDRWVVKPHAGGGQNPHGDMGANPHGGMPMPGAPAAPGALPPGHPAVPQQSSPK